jgi:hypothetical protein
MHTANIIGWLLAVVLAALLAANIVSTRLPAPALVAPAPSGQVLGGTSAGSTGSPEQPIVSTSAGSGPTSYEDWQTGLVQRPVPADSLSSVRLVPPSR